MNNTIILAGFFVAAPLYGMDDVERELCQQFVPTEPTSYAIANEQDELGNTSLHRELLQIGCVGRLAATREKIIALVKAGVNPYVQNVCGLNAFQLCYKIPRSIFMKRILDNAIHKTRTRYYYVQTLQRLSKKKFFPREVAEQITGHIMELYDYYL